MGDGDGGDNDAPQRAATAERDQRGPRPNMRETPGGDPVVDPSGPLLSTIRGSESKSGWR